MFEAMKSVKRSNRSILKMLAEWKRESNRTALIEQLFHSARLYSLLIVESTSIYNYHGKFLRSTPSKEGLHRIQEVVESTLFRD